MGYDHPVVALTANAVSGQAEIFLGNGFNDFISKPIDVRQLNNVLNKLIRDKQPPEIIEAARRQAEMKNGNTDETSSKSGIDPQFAKIFVRDAEKSLAVLDEINEKGSYDEEGMRTYIIHVHGMKSALANIGKMDISAVAMRLETSARDGDTAVIVSDTPAFLDSLRTVIKELTPKEESISGGDTSDEDPEYLQKELLAIKTACEEYDEMTAEKIISELKTKMWSQATNEMFETITEHLFISDFDEVVIVIDRFLEL